MSREAATYHCDTSRMSVIPGKLGLPFSLLAKYLRALSNLKRSSLVIGISTKPKEPTSAIYATEQRWRADSGRESRRSGGINLADNAPPRLAARLSVSPGRW